jgi:putative nucleotidyltransferase with HDIG domain
MNIPTLQYLSKLVMLTHQIVYLVGGSVRDLLIGIRDIKDIDLLMPSGSENVARTFADEIGGSFFFLDEERKITRVVTHEAEEVIQFDFTNYEGPDLRADLARRDFTVNSMAVDLRKFIKDRSLDGLIDLFDGREDVRQKLIRVANPKVLDDDPLRLLRAVRFAASLGFNIEQSTADEIRIRADLVTRPSPERVRDEVFQVLSQRRAGPSLLLMESLGLLERLFPELDGLTGFAPGWHQQYDIRTHSLKAAAYVDSALDDLEDISPEYAPLVQAHLDEPLERFVPRKAALRFACLLHDIGKPETFTQDEAGVVHFFGHDSVGADKVKEACGRFRLSRDSESVMTKLVKHHMRLFHLSAPAPGAPSKRALYRYCRDLGDALPESVLLAISDSRATAELMEAIDFMDTEKSAGAVLDYYYGKFLKTEAKPLVTGNDLIALGMRPGPKFREVLDEIRERQAEGTLKTREEALEYVNNFLATD